MRFYPFLALGLLVVSCDKSEKVPPPRSQAVSASRAIRFVQSAQDDLVKLREESQMNLRRATEIVSPEERGRAVAAAIWNLADLDPDLARESLVQLVAGSDARGRLAQHLALRLAERDVDEAIRWAATLETEAERSLAIGGVSLVLAEADPKRAASLLSESGIPGREFDVSVVQVVQRWAASSPADAASWVAVFDPSDARSAGLKTVFSRWVEADARAAFAWVAALPDETARQGAALEMAGAIWEQPENTQENLLQLAPPEIRARVEQLKAEAAKG